MIDFDEQVRSMLNERAADVRPSPDAWERILDRLQDEPVPVLSVYRAKRRAPRLMMLGSVAAAFLVLLGVAAALVSSRDRGGRDTNIAAEGQGGPEGGAATTDTPAPAPAGGEKPIWPLSGGFSDELSEARATAEAYLSERFAQKVPFALGEYERGDDVSGRVVYTTPPGAERTGSVYLRHADGRWFVTSAGSEGLSIQMADYTGTTLTAEASPAVAGRVNALLTKLDGGGAVVGTETFDLPASADRPLSISREVPGAVSVVLELRLADPANGGVYLAEARVESAAAAAADATVVDQESAAAVAREWVRLVGAGELDAAYELLDANSQAGGRSAFRAMSSELAEGWGAWSRADDVLYREVELHSRRAVVQVTGTVAREGERAWSAAALPLRKQDDGSWRVDPFGKAEPLTLDPESPFTARVPASSTAWWVIDGERHAARVRGSEAELSPPPKLGAGRHAVTVIVETRAGQVATRSITLTL